MGIHTNKHAKNAERRRRGAESSISGDASEINGPDPIPDMTRNTNRIGNEVAKAVPKLPILAKRMPQPTRRRALVELLRCADAGADMARPNCNIEKKV
jgi:hypothetical protein